MKSFFRLKKKSGFTLLELLLSVSVIAIITAFCLPAYAAWQARNDLQVATNVIVENLRRAQLLSQASSGDSVWGVYLSNTEIVVFKGTTYLTRDINYDEIFMMPKSVSVQSSPKEIVFNKLSGQITSAQTLTLNSSISQSITISINEKGMVFY